MTDPIRRIAGDIPRLAPGTPAVLLQPLYIVDEPELVLDCPTCDWTCPTCGDHELAAYAELHRSLGCQPTYQPGVAGNI